MNQLDTFTAFGILGESISPTDLIEQLGHTWVAVITSLEGGEDIIAMSTFSPEEIKCSDEELHRAGCRNITALGALFCGSVLFKDDSLMFKEEDRGTEILQTIHQVPLLVQNGLDDDSRGTIRAVLSPTGEVMASNHSIVAATINLTVPVLRIEKAPRAS